jgi:RimJ/RimL family protein N-acetyltransferase
VSAFAAATIVTERLLLVPLRPEDADEMVDVLADPGLHQFIGGHPATLEELRARHATLTAGSPRLEEVWRNWIVRRRGHPWQHQGYASEAARALVGWLDSRHVHDLVAHIHPDHVASAKVAVRAGFQPTHDQVDGERVWRRQTSRLRSRCRRS